MAYSTTPGDARPLGRRVHRLRPRRLLVLDRAGAFGKLLPERWRSLAFGAGTAAGSFGQFLYSPLAVSLMDAFGWQTALLIFARRDAAGAAAVARACDGARGSRNGAWRGDRSRCGRRCRRRSATAPIVLLVLGFFTCGFQLAFITVHLPAYLVDQGLSDAGRRLDHRRDRAVQHHRLAHLRLARRSHAEALHPLVHLFRPRARRSSPSSRSRSRRCPRSCSAPSWGCSGCRRWRRPTGSSP